MGELLVVFGLQVVLSAVGIPSHASAVGHIVGTGIAEGFEDGIGSLLPDFEHNLALCLVALPMVCVAAEVLEALHLGTQSLAFPHVVEFAVAVLRVVSTPDVVTEMAVVEPVGTYQP